MNSHLLALTTDVVVCKSLQCVPVVVATGHDEVAVIDQKSDYAPIRKSMFNIHVVTDVVVVVVVTFVDVDDVVDDEPATVEKLVFHHLR